MSTAHPPSEGLDVPHSAEAEQSVLGALFLDNRALEEIAEVVEGQHFFEERHRIIFEHTSRLIRRGEPADVMTVFASLQAERKLETAGGMSYLSELLQNVPTAKHVRHYAGLVRERADRRAAMEIGRQLLAEAARHRGKALPEILQGTLDRIRSVGERGAHSSLRPLDLHELASKPVPERRHRVGRIMALGTPGIITGHGGAGKTQLKVRLLICIAMGLPFFGEPVEPGVAALVSGEDEQADLHWRLAQECRALGVEMQDLAGRLFVYPLEDVDPTLLAEGDRDVIVPTPRYWRLVEQFRRSGVQVAAFDNIATLTGCEVIKPREATQVLSLFQRMLPRDGNAIVSGHVDKPTAIAGYSRQAYLGSGAWHNRSRWRWYLYAPSAEESRGSGDAEPLDDGRRVLEVQKNNAGPEGSRFLLRLVEGALEPDGAHGGIVASIARNNERTGVLTSLREAEERDIPVPTAETNKSTAYETLVTMPSYPASLRGREGKRRLLQMLRQARTDGDVEVYEFNGAGRHKREGYRLARIEK